MNSKTLTSFAYKIGLLLLLIVIVAIYNYFTDASKNKDIDLDVEAPTIDYYANNISMTQYQQDGNIEYRMTAEKLEHNERTDIAYLTQPTAHIYKNADNPWFIRSNTGEIGPKGDTVELFDDIKGTQVDSKGKTNTFEIGKTKNDTDPIRYGEVMIYPDKKYAESKDYAIVTSPDGQTSGVGIKAYFDTNQIQFLSKVQTHILRGQHAAD